MSGVTWAAMVGAVLFEMLGTALLQQSAQFTRTWPTIGLTICYAIAFYLLSLALRQMPVSVAYAIWSGLGITLTAIVGWFVFKQRLDAPAMIGMGLILGGVLVMNLFSKSMSH